MKKFKDLITRQGSGAKEDLSPVSDPGVSPSPPSSPHEVVAKTKDEREFPNDPTSEAEVIASIEEYYFRDDSFDSSKYELEKIPRGSEKIHLSSIDDDRNKLRRQLQAVTKKMSDVILENQTSYSTELVRVTELQGCLENASAICRNGRSELDMTMQGFTVASLGIMAKHKKKLQLLNLLKSLHTIKTLQRTDIRLREMLEEEDYPGAIQLCLECQNAAVTFGHYKCISDLSSKLQDTLESIEEQLDKALAKTCTDFDLKHYEKLQAAYQLLGKSETAMDQLHMHFTSSIQNIAFQIVLGYVQLVTGSTDPKFQKMQFRDLCSQVDLETYIPCLVDICKALWEVMKSYYKTMDWHHKQSLTGQDTASEETGIGGSINTLYIKQKLEHGLTRIWQDVQQKVKLFLLATDLSNIKYDDFIYVLDLVNRLIDIGQEFCGSGSEGLHDSIRQQSLRYFKNYHSSRMEELRMFMENEGWEVCPVKSNFTYLNLHEFRFLRPATSGFKEGQSLNSPNSPTLGSITGFFEKFSEIGSPFDKQLADESEETGIVNGMNDEGMGFDESDDEDEVSDELKQDYIDELTGEGCQRGGRRNMESMYSKGPTLCNTTIKVLRLYGKYMQMISVLKPIAFDVVLCMSELFDYYLFSIYSFFASDVSNGAALGLNSKLWTTLKRISDNIKQQTSPSQGMMGNPMQAPENAGFPCVSPIVQLSNIDHLHGLAERIVGTESLVFVAEQLEFLQPHLEAVIPSAKKPFLLQFYSQTVSVACELRGPIYQGVASQSINLDRILQMMMTVRWDIKDIMSQHSMYVDHVLQIFGEFNSRLEGVSRRVPIPAEAYKTIWEHVIKLANKIMVEGFATAKKCSNEGRALMQLDYQQFLLKLEGITHLRPIPDKDFVEAYIKAFYLNEVDMENWVKEHKEYSARQLTGLINCAVGNKRTRHRILNVIEEFEKNRPR